MVMCSKALSEDGVEAVVASSPLAGVVVDGVEAVDGLGCPGERGRAVVDEAVGVGAAGDAVGAVLRDAVEEIREGLFALGVFVT